MASSSVSHQKSLHIDKVDVSVPAITTKNYTDLSVSPGSSHVNDIIGWSIIIHDRALQATLVWSDGGYRLTVFNAYSGTSGATTCEVHWLKYY